MTTSIACFEITDDAYGRPLVEIEVSSEIGDDEDTEHRWRAATGRLGRLVAMLHTPRWSKPGREIYCSGFGELDAGNPPTVFVTITPTDKRETLETLTTILRRISETE